MTCPDNSCRTIQILEPDPNLDVLSFRADPAVDEHGEMPLLQGMGTITVSFHTPKASATYRFEYLYVDCLGLVQPGAVEPVVTSQTQFGFTVDFAGAPLATGYILRWRVVVVDLVSPVAVDAPESIYQQIPADALTVLVTFSQPRSSLAYGFSELRIENLVDPAAQQTPVLAQVVAKTLLNFTVALNPSPPTDNYYLVVRTP